MHLQELRLPSGYKCGDMRLILMEHGVSFPCPCCCAEVFWLHFAKTCSGNGSNCCSKNIDNNDPLLGSMNRQARCIIDSWVMLLKRMDPEFACAHLDAMTADGAAEYCVVLLSVTWLSCIVHEQTAELHWLAQGKGNAIFSHIASS